MQILMGNTQPIGGPGPAVTETGLRDIQREEGQPFEPAYTVGTDAAEIRDHLFSNPGMVTHLPGNEAIASVTRSWADHSSGNPSWVAVEPGQRSEEEAADFERFLSEFWRCDRGVPADLEQTHYTFNGPPGVGPAEGE